MGLPSATAQAIAHGDISDEIGTVAICTAWIDGQQQNQHVVTTRVPVVALPCTSPQMFGVVGSEQFGTSLDNTGLHCERELGNFNSDIALGFYANDLGVKTG